MKNTNNIVEIYIQEVARLHDVPREMISERDPKFTFKFWMRLFKGLGTNLNFSTKYHLDFYGKIERVNYIIKDMLWMYLMDKSRWEDDLHLVEFVYNNGYQPSLKMIPFEAMYGIRLNTLIIWSNPMDMIMGGIEFIRDMEEKVVKIKKNLKVSQDRKRIYEPKNMTNKEFKIGEDVCLKLKAKKISVTLGSCVKVEEIYYGTFEIL